MDGKKKLLMKRKERDNKQLLKAFSESEKTLAEVIEFLQGYITIGQGKKKHDDTNAV